MDAAEFRVLDAMMKAGLRRKRKLTPVEAARRLAAEAERQARRYCDAFALWRTCRRRACRRHRCCGGDVRTCLKAALARVPHPMQAAVRARILKATPHNIGAPERTARQYLPDDVLR